MLSYALARTHHGIEVFPSVFFMKKEENATIENDQQGISITVQSQDLLIKRRVKTHPFPLKKATTGGFSVSQFIEQVINNCIEKNKDNDWL